MTVKNAEAILARGRSALTSGRRRGLRELNEQFHRALAEAGRNRLLFELLDQLRARSALLFSPDDPDRQAVSWQEHTGILQAIIDGDEELAAKRAMTHVLGAGEAHLQAAGMAGAAPPSADELAEKKQERG